MTDRNIFSILLCSSALTVFFLTTIRRQSKFGGGLPLLLQSFIRAPRIGRVESATRFGTYGYATQLKTRFLNATVGRSVFLLLEDDVLLPHPRALSGQEVAKTGGGRYLHVENTIFFSPSDNVMADRPIRDYKLIETLTEDMKKVSALRGLNKQRTGTGNFGLWLLAKLQVYLGAALQIGTAVPEASGGFHLSEVGIDCRPLGFGEILAKHIAVQWSGPENDWYRIEIQADAVTAPWLAGPAHIEMTVGCTADCHLRLERAILRGGDQVWADMSLSWSAAGLTSAALHLSDLASIRAGMSEACGTAAEYQTWLTGFVAALRDGDIPLGCRIDADAAAILIATLAPAATVAGLQAIVEQDADEQAPAGLTLRCLTEGI